MDGDGDVPLEAPALGTAIAPAIVRRKAAIVRRQRGEAAAEIAADLGVSVRSVHRWWRRWQADGTVRRRPGSGRRPRITAPIAADLISYLTTHPTGTWADLCHWLAETHAVTVSVPTMARTLRRLGWSYQNLTHH